eukprot:gb/GECG01008939.1/.p1 GENE.gb/GECG01008939.1/~~gb/GECG01008939.1/.p1  ORF type:complete len:119 (+),score=6.95 gb/GECG01008939.1/:1-357(+)
MNLPLGMDFHVPLLVKRMRSTSRLVGYLSHLCVCHGGNTAVRERDRGNIDEIPAVWGTLVYGDEFGKVESSDTLLESFALFCGMACSRTIHDLDWALRWVIANLNAFPNTSIRAVHIR